MPAALPTASSSTISEALSAAKASASHPPVRSRLAMYNTRMLGGRALRTADAAVVGNGMLRDFGFSVACMANSSGP